MDHLVEELHDAIAAWDDMGWPRPVAALVSGSGLAFDFGLPSRERAGFDRLLPFAVSPIEGHPLEVELLEPIQGKPVLYWRGRLHSYQGYTAAETVFAVRLSALLGAHSLILTNAAGGLDSTMSPGDLVMIEDHLNLTGLNPLRGKPPNEWGPRFPDLTSAYDEPLRRRLREHAEAEDLTLRSGVYAGLAGPSYETPAEVRMLQTMGATTVGMSTVLEVIAARHLGVRCAAVSLVTNAAAGHGDGQLDHEEVLLAGREAVGTLRRVLQRILVDDLFLDPDQVGPEGR